ncbi:hypothetical protein DFH08DRAFT_430011 [Mycena albidolilacea]|uniref:F-box domain-containing protein n=1 Tax=Mycena albidolilacea TaxID=1033008 RepID=A0AAD6ZAE7_9AGAR|nr:hypothetical protein DFH08DRAFT_430011 [Mycena albidolilacea]
MAESLHSCPKCMHVFGLSGVDLPPPTPTVVPADLLETNDPPLESQIPILRDFLSNRRPLMTALDAQIAVLQAPLDTLLQRKAEMVLEIGAHKGALSLLRRMPTEILGHIFRLTLPPHQRYAIESAPWTISAVCARWREIVISQPCFWTSIRYKEAKRSIPNGLKYETQLRRSGELPLNIEFHLNDEEALLLYYELILEMVCKHAGRWETASFRGPGILFDQLQRLIQEQLGHLRKLSIEVEHTDENHPVDIFHDAPLLQTVYVNREMWVFPVVMVLPWSQLSRYGGSNTWEGHRNALLGASNLVECSLEIQSPPITTQSPIVLPRLLRLSLSNSQFLGYLETPALLELYCDYDTVPILSFLRQQACRLRKLVLWDCSSPDDPANLTRIVEAVPTITSLSQLFPLPLGFARDFSSRPTMAPALEYFSSFPTSEEVEEHFLQAIEQRWLHHRLKSVKVYNTDSLTIRDRLELLRTQGMECVVFKGPRPYPQEDIPGEFRISTIDFD